MITPLDILSLETWILIISVLVLFRLYIHKKWQVLKDLNIPHDPPTILGLGNLTQYFKDPDYLFKQDSILKKKFGYVCGYYFWTTPRICISDPKILKEILVKEATTFRDRQVSFSKINGKEMNTALTAVRGDQWKRIRSTLSPTFSTSKLKEMIGIIENCTDKMVKSLYKTCEKNNGRFETKDIFGKLSMDVICSAAFSADVHTQDGDESELVQKTKACFEKALFQSPIMVLFAFFPWTEKIAEMLNYSLFPKDLLRYYNKLTQTIIENQQQSIENPRVDIMQQMLKNEISEKDVKAGAVKGLTRTEITGNAFIMIIAGYETTANTLILFAYCLALSKEVQSKLREEIEDLIENQGGLTYDGIHSMKYLDMCMKESQRLYPAIPRNSRFSDREITIRGIKIPGGIHVDVPIVGMSHDEEYWDEPWEYKPERFEDMSKIDPIIFQPFGAGPRNCIGQRFAILIVKMAICKLIQHFYLDVCDDTPTPPLAMEFKGSMKPKKAVFLRVSPINDVPNGGVPPEACASQFQST